MKDRAHFITSCIFGRQLKVVKLYKATFTEKEALAFLYKLEKTTLELVAIYKQVTDLTAKFEVKYLNKMVAKISAENTLYSVLAYNQMKALFRLQYENTEIR